MKKWIRELIIGDRFEYLKIDIDNLDCEVRKLRKEIVDLRNEILFENKSLLKLILQERKVIADVKNNIEAVGVDEEKPVIKKELPAIPEQEVKIVKPILTQKDVKELFDYRDGDLYWKIDIYGGRCGKVKIVKAGTICGTKGVKYQGKIYRISRLIFLMFNGYLPEKVTFKDGNSLNRKIDNLLEATNSQIQIRKQRVRSSSGYLGVSYRKDLSKYCASIGVNGKQLNLGYYNTPEEASKVYQEAKIKYQGKFLSKCDKKSYS